jgi:hypothetical protein
VLKCAPTVNDRNRLVCSNRVPRDRQAPSNLLGSRSLSNGFLRRVSQRRKPPSPLSLRNAPQARSS